MPHIIKLITFDKIYSMKKLFTLVFIIAAGFSVKAQNVYGTMETWLTYTADTATLERPQGWNGSDSVAYGIVFTGLTPVKQIFQDTHAHGGTYSAKLVTSDIGLLVAGAIITNGNIEVDVIGQTFEITGGTNVSQRIAYMNCWVDYQPQGSDAGLMSIQAYKNGIGVGGSDSLIGEATISNDGTNGFEGFAMPLNYTDGTTIPDRILIAFASSEDAFGGVDGSIMYVDDVTISTVSVKDTKANSHTVKCYPNPATSVLNLLSMNNERLSLDIYNITGQKVLQQFFTSKGKADLGGLNSGVYFYTVSNTEGEIIKQEKLVIN
jgi:hypothetical protein